MALVDRLMVVDSKGRVAKFVGEITQIAEPKGTTPSSSDPMDVIFTKSFCTHQNVQYKFKLIRITRF